MSTVVLIQARPRRAANGQPFDVRLAGGGSSAYTQLGFADWRSGVSNAPRFSTAIGFGQGGLTQGALPQTGAVRFFPSDKALLSALGGYVWDGAEIIVTAGDDETNGPYAPLLVGTVASYRTDGGAITLTLGDLSIDLSKPACPNLFAGTGDLEGGEEATGRVKRRSWGKVFNVEGKLLDKANNVYEFGDPSRPLRSFDMVKDKGRAGDMVVIGWQGNALDTLKALRAATVPVGGAAVAPSIACVKWWTVPAGPLTADFVGDASGGMAPALLARDIVGAFSARIAVENTAQAQAWVNATAGIHVDNASETVGNVLDRLLLPVFIAWVLDGAGTFKFRRVTWSNPVDTVFADTISRDETFRPLKSRKLGFQANNRQHTDAEISATLLLATDATYADGTPIEVLKPATAGATAGAPEGTTIGGKITNGVVLGGMPAKQALEEIQKVSPLANDLAAQQLDISAIKDADVARDEALDAFRDRLSPVEASVSALEEAREVDAEALERLVYVVADQDALQRQAENSLATIEEALLRTLLEDNRNREIFRSAGIVVDEATGRVTISALDQTRERLATAEILIDGVRGQIRTKAEISYVQDQIALAVIDPSQVAELAPLQARVSTVEQDLDAAKAAINLRATDTALSAVERRTSAAEVKIDGLNSEIALKAEKAVVDDLGIALDSVKVVLSNLPDTTGYTVEVSQARGIAEDTATAALRTQLALDAATRFQFGQTAIARQELDATIRDLTAAEAVARTTLAIRVDAVSAYSLEQARLSIDRDSVLADNITGLTIAKDAQAAAIVTLTKASIDATGGIAGVQTTIKQQAGDSDTTAEALLRSLLTADATGQERARQIVRLQTETTTTLVANEQASALARQALTARLNSAEAAIVTSSRILTDQIKAEAEQRQGLEVAFYNPVSGLGATRAQLSALSKVVTDGNKATADRIDEIVVRIDSPTTGLAAAFAAITAAEEATVSGDQVNAQAIERIELAQEDQALSIATLTKGGIANGVSIAGISTTIRQQYGGEAEGAEAMLRALIVGDVTGQERARQIVQLQQETTTQLVANEMSSAVARLALAARINGAEAAIVQASKVTTDLVKAQADRTTALEAVFYSPTDGLAPTRARVTLVERAYSDLTLSTAQRFERIDAQVNDPETGLPKTHADLASLSQAFATEKEASAQSFTDVHASITRSAATVAQQAEDNRAAGEQRLKTDIDDNYDRVHGELSDLDQSRIDGDQQNKELIQNVDGRVTDLARATADQDGVLAESIRKVETTVGDQTSQIELILRSIDGDEATAALLATVDGRVTGLRINGKDGDFIIDAASKFIVGNTQIFEVDLATGETVVSRLKAGVVTAKEIAPGAVMRSYFMQTSADIVIAYG